MFAPKVAKPSTNTAEGSTSRLASQRSTLAEHRHCRAPVEQFLLLQSNIGNQAKLRLLAQRYSGLNGNELREQGEQDSNPARLTARQARTPGISLDFSKVPVFPPDRASRPQSSSPITATPLPSSIQAEQAELVAGQVGDPLEQEADRVADKVMRVPDTDVSIAEVPTPVSRKCAACEVEQTKILQSKPVEPAGTAPGEVPDIVHDVLRSPGNPLDTASRSFFEPRFGHDFRQVRVHADETAAASAGAVGARAYTVGSHVVFAADQYSPSTADGRRLMAHELTHVLQRHGSSQDREGREMPALSTAPEPTLMRQEVSDSVDDMDLDQSQDQFASTQAAKSAKSRKTKPTPPPVDRIPTATSPSAGALKALEAARKLHDQQDPAIWFDSWGNDLRDNNLNGTIDEKAEQGIADGRHYGKAFDAKICSSPSDTTDHCPLSGQTMIKVQYKVCIDIPIESYKSAGANIPTSRWIPTFFGELRSKPNWTVWKKPAAPPQLLDGDIVAADNADHQHAGVADTGLIDFVINLPGPTSSRKFHLFNPSGKNDMVSVPRILFESYLSIDWVAGLNK